ncbi:actin cytoskeleton-regulatory complex protein pan1-like [Pyrus communis]|uniref:actin cytoskeleton-regulatory complex protein pan1-like n=1 Tax=Pyrus communis TaxID=23211 RepID=UPI0035C07511
MEDLGNNHRLDSISSAVRKKRSQTFRRPRPDSYTELHDESPLSSTTPSDDQSKVSSDENAGCDANSKRKELSLNECMARGSSAAGNGEKPHKKDSKGGGCNSFYKNEQGRNESNNKRSSEGCLAPANWKSSSLMKDDLISESISAGAFNGRNGESPSTRLSGFDGFGNENKVKKVKLKVGGVTRTIQANSTLNGTTEGGSTTKTARLSDVSRPRQKQNLLLENSDDNHSPSDKKRGLKGIPWKDFSRSGISLGRDNCSMGRTAGKNTYGKEGDGSEPVRKSKRVPKRRILDGDFGDEEEDDEIRYLEKLKISKVAAVYRDDDDESSRKHRKLSAVSNIDNASASRLDKDLKRKSRTDRVSGDTDHEEEQGSLSDGEVEGKKKQKKEAVNSLVDGKKEVTLTTRQRTLQSSKDATPGSCLIEFPNGLPPAPSRKQKEKLTDVEQQLKKAEAAQRRRMQVEKAARESEAEAIRKILGQDSSRKKREDKIKKRQEEIAQERAANALTLPPNTIRTVMGPAGTVVTFSNDMGLPSLFDPKPCSYPTQRENCAGPSCTNPYKYRDSKSQLPLCSLKCYTAIQEKTAVGTTC